MPCRLLQRLRVSQVERERHLPEKRDVFGTELVLDVREACLERCVAACKLCVDVEVANHELEHEAQLAACGAVDALADQAGDADRGGDQVVGEAPEQPLACCRIPCRRQPSEADRSQEAIGQRRQFAELRLVGLGRTQGSVRGGALVFGFSGWLHSSNCGGSHAARARGYLLVPPAGGSASGWRSGGSSCRPASKSSPSWRPTWLRRAALYFHSCA